MDVVPLSPTEDIDDWLQKKETAIPASTDDDEDFDNWLRDAFAAQPVAHVNADESLVAHVAADEPLVTVAMTTTAHNNHVAADEIVDHAAADEVVTYTAVVRFASIPTDDWLEQFYIDLDIWLEKQVKRIRILTGKTPFAVVPKKKKTTEKKKKTEKKKIEKIKPPTECRKRKTPRPKIPYSWTKPSPFKKSAV
jgi:hypothetical protein